jgi:hypothetical protein
MPYSLKLAPKIALISERFFPFSPLFFRFNPNLPMLRFKFGDANFN